MAWLVGWNRRKSKIINGLSTEMTNIMFSLTVFKGPGIDTENIVYCNNNIRDDFIDIRFTKQDGITPLNYRILSYIPGVNAEVIVEIDVLPASPGSVQIYMYYDNPTATDAQNPSLSPYNIIASNNLNDEYPFTDTPYGWTCGPKYDLTYTHTIPSTFDEAWVAIQGLTTYETITNDVNGVGANDLYILYINGSIAFNVSLPGTENTCVSPVTRCMQSDSICGKSVNVTDILSPLKGQSVNFNIQLIDSQGTGFDATSGAVYFISAPIPIVNLGIWGSEEIALSNIIATDIIPSSTTCTEPCNITVDITWTNDGIAPGTFEPAIIIDTIRTGTDESITLDPLQTITRTFTITGLTKGIYEICADPNSLPCATVTVEKVSGAGIGTILIAGLALGFFIFASKKEEKKEKR